AYFFLFILVCALHVFWQRSRRIDLAAVVATTLLLAGTKVAYSISPAPAVAPLLGGAAAATGRLGRARMRVVSLAAACLIGASACLVATLPAGELTKSASYHFVFRGVLPQLAPEE